jgi:citrate lyase subunit beta/citryl-CoA lyase
MESGRSIDNGGVAVTRSLFFVPANRLDLIRKLPRFDADVSVIDLEDGTPPAEKDSARSGLAEAIKAVRADGHEGRILVRVNEPKSKSYLADLQAALATDADGVLIPKLETREELFVALHVLDHVAKAHAQRTKSISAGLESVRGILNAVSLCSADPRLAMVYFGAEDFISDIGGARTEKGDEVLYARSQVVLAAKAAGIVAIDQAVADVRNDELYRRDAEAGRNLGYQGKICVIPRQLALCHDVFSPSATEVEAARRLISAYEQAVARNIGTIEFEGKLIDGPMLKRAERIVTISERIARGRNAA